MRTLKCKEEEQGPVGGVEKEEAEALVEGED